MQENSKDYIFVDDLKLKEGDTVTYLHLYTDENGEEWEEEERCILDYYVSDDKINLKRSNGKYVWVTKNDIVGKIREPNISEAKANSFKKQISTLQETISELQQKNERLENKEKTKNEKQINKLSEKMSNIEKQFKELTERVQIWIKGYEPIEDEE